MKFNQDYVPSTINEAIDLLYNSLQPTDIEDIKKTKPHEVHFTLGMFLRNNWSLWKENNPVLLDCKKRFNLFGHGDDLSGLILDGLWAKVCGKSVDAQLNETAERFRRHWNKCGVNPETGAQYE